MNDEHGLPAVPKEEKKPSLVQKSKELLDSAVSSLKGQDLNKLVDTYTSEVTVVLEGMGEDLARLTSQTEDASARLTLLEEENRRRAEEAREREAEQKKREDELQKALAETRRALEKQTEKVERDKKKRGTVTGALRQITWIAAILGGAWVITTLIHAFVKG